MWAKGEWIWFCRFTLVFWISMNTLLPEVLVPPSDIFNFATMDPRANIACAALALAANVALFAYWLYKIVACKRNPVTGVLYCELADFSTIVREHCDDKDKYFLVDRIPQSPAELGFEPDSPTPPPDGYRAWMPWWGGGERISGTRRRGVIVRGRRCSCRAPHCRGLPALSRGGLGCVGASSALSLFRRTLAERRIVMRLMALGAF